MSSRTGNRLGGLPFIQRPYTEARDTPVALWRHGYGYTLRGDVGGWLNRASTIREWAVQRTSTNQPEWTSPYLTFASTENLQTTLRPGEVGSMCVRASHVDSTTFKYVIGTNGTSGASINKKDASKYWQGSVGDTACVSDVVASTNPAAPDHVVLTWDGSTISLYVNGALENSVARGNAVSPSNYFLGFPTASRFLGTINDAAFFTSMLNATQVGQLYAKSVTPLQIAGCVAWFEEGVGICQPVSAWADQTGNGHHYTQTVGSDQGLLTPWGIDVDGTDYLNADTLGAVFTGTDVPITVVTVVDTTNCPNSKHIWAMNKTVTLTYARLALFIDVSAGNNRCVVYNVDDANSSKSVYQLTASPIYLKASRIVRHTGTTTDLWNGSTRVMNAAASDAGARTFDWFAFPGMKVSTGTVVQNAMTGVIRDMAVFTGTPSDAAIARLIGRGAQQARLL